MKKGSEEPLFASGDAGAGATPLLETRRSLVPGARKGNPGGEQEVGALRPRLKPRRADRRSGRRRGALNLHRLASADPNRKTGRRRAATANSTSRSPRLANRVRGGDRWPFASPRRGRRNPPCKWR